jgi:carbonic anhydrase
MWSKRVRLILGAIGLLLIMVVLEVPAAKAQERVSTDARSAQAGHVESAGSAAPEEAHAVVHWGYEAENGPAKWASLQPEWALCAEGRHQSPIDLTSP